MTSIYLFLVAYICRLGCKKAIKKHNTYLEILQRVRYMFKLNVINAMQKWSTMVNVVSFQSFVTKSVEICMVIKINK